MAVSSDTTRDLVEYYSNLLILQYHGKPKAKAHVETTVTPTLMPQSSIYRISFFPLASSGTFTLRYMAGVTSALAYDVSAAALQTALRLLPGLGSVTVSGSATAGFTVKMLGITPPPSPRLELEASTTTGSGVTSVPTVVETDKVLPLAIEAAFDLVGSNVASGVHLDISAKYVGVLRSCPGFSTVITLSDADFLTLIRIATELNSMGSSLAEIQALVHEYFPNQLLVFDYANMHMSYLIESSVGSTDLVQAFVTQQLIPKPMGVQVSNIIYMPNIAKLFGFGTYFFSAYNVTPFNEYGAYHTDWPWLSYANSVSLSA